MSELLLGRTIHAGVTELGARLHAWLPPGALNSLLVDGVVAGAGSVLVFLPQILILFFFILLLEESAYLPRAAYLLDRLMGSVGLSCRAFIPLLSSFACAVPGIMATRTIPNVRDRIGTIMIAPLMTCSARLPVYALIIAAFIPNRPVGPFNLQGLVLFTLYVTGILAAMAVAYALKRTALRSSYHPLLHELPEYHWPHLNNLLIGLWERTRVFLQRILPAIHRIDRTAHRLGFLAEPAPGRSPAADELERYEQILRGISPDPHPAFELAIRWLRQRIPPGDERVVVHGDVRIGNVIFGPEGVRAVLDWELAHVGDPMEDLAWICVRSWRFGNDHLPVGGIGTREELFDAYARAAGRRVDPERVRFWEVLGNLKWGIMTIMQAKTRLDGFVTSIELASIGRRTMPVRAAPPPARGAGSAGSDRTGDRGSWWSGSRGTLA